MILPDLLPPFLVSFAIALVVLFLAGIIARKNPSTANLIASSIAPTAGFLSGTLFVRSFPELPPSDSIGWLFWVMILTALLAPIKNRIPALEKGFPPAAIALLSLLLLKPFIGQPWSRFESVLWIGSIFLIWLTAYLFIDRLQKAPRSWKPLVLLVIATTGLALLLTLSGTLSYGLYALTLSGAIAAPALCSIGPFRPVFPFDLRPATILIAIPSIGLLFGGYFFAEMPTTAAVLTLVSFTAFALPSISKIKRLRAGSLFLFQLAWLIFPLLMAIVWTGR